MSLTAKGINTLIAEDDVAVATGFKRILEKSGYRVVGIAHDGIEALDLNPAGYAADRR